MSNEQVYLKYISYIMKNVMVMTQSYEWKKILRDHLGNDSSNIKVSDLKNLALKIYYARFISLGACEHMYGLISRRSLDHSDMKQVLINTINFRKSQEFGDIPLVYYMNENDVINHIKTLSENSSTLPVLDLMKSEKVLDKQPKKTSNSKSANSGLTKLTLLELKKLASDKKIKGRSKMTKKQLITELSKSRNCGEYTIITLKELASGKKIKGRSKMTKKELCNSLGIRE